MKDDKLAIAKVECERFLARLAERDELSWESITHEGYTVGKDKYPAFTTRSAAGEGQVNGAIKRASLDLSRALAALRKS